MKCCPLAGFVLYLMPPFLNKKIPSYSADDVYLIHAALRTNVVEWTYLCFSYKLCGLKYVHYWVELLDFPSFTCWATASLLVGFNFWFRNVSFNTNYMHRYIINKNPTTLLDETQQSKSSFFLSDPTPTWLNNPHPY